MVSSQAERRNGSIHGQPCGNLLNERMASGKSQDTKRCVYSRRSSEPQFCLPPGDAAIAACASVCALRPRFHAISGQLVLLSRRSWSKLISPGFQNAKQMSKKTKNTDRNRPEMTTPSCFEPDVCVSMSSRVEPRVITQEQMPAHAHTPDTASLELARPAGGSSQHLRRRREWGGRASGLAVLRCEPRVRGVRGVRASGAFV